MQQVSNIEVLFEEKNKILEEKISAVYSEVIVKINELHDFGDDSFEKQEKTNRFITNQLTELTKTTKIKISKLFEEVDSYEKSFDEIHSTIRILNENQSEQNDFIKKKSEAFITALERFYFEYSNRIIRCNEINRCLKQFLCDGT